MHYPSKPRKFRIVFDCGVEYNGASLNKKFLSGTNLTQPTNWGVDEIQRRGSGIHIRYRSNVLSGLDSSRAEKLGEISMIKEWNI